MRWFAISVPAVFISALGALAGSGVLFAANPPATATAPAVSHDALVKLFQDGKFDELESDLAVIHDGTLPAAEKTDDFFMRQVLTESHPAWWKTVKLGKTCTFTPKIWNRTLNVTYDPAKTDMQLSIINGRVSVTTGWPAADMDSPANAEHGFTKGELQNLGVWSTLGMVDGYASVPVASLQNLDDVSKQRLNRYLDFRGDVAGVYYGSPRARRWALWLYLDMYNARYAQMDIMTSRRSVAIFFMTEVISHPELFPDMKIPPEMKDAGESKIADRLRLFLEKNALPLAEDKALRDAVKTFAAANEAPAFKSGQVNLPNQQVASFDPKIDDTQRTKREAWIKEQLSKPPATAPAKQ